MKRLVLLAPLVLAACNSQPSLKAENASVAEVSAKAQAAIKFTPGAWKGTTEMLAVNIPGMPADAMKKALTKTEYSNCLTKEQAEKPPSEMFGGEGSGGCRYETFTMAGGKIDAVMICPAQQGAQPRMTMTGTYASDHYDVTTNMVMKMPANAGGQTMTIKARTSGARTGECKA